MLTPGAAAGCAGQDCTFRVRFSRPLTTGDAEDEPLFADTATMFYTYAWYSVQNHPDVHSTNLDQSLATTIQLGGSGANHLLSVVAAFISTFAITFV